MRRFFYGCRMANKTSSLTLKLIDQLSGPSKKAADALKKVGASSKALDDAKKRAADFTKAAERFGRSKDSFSAAAKGMREASERVKDLARQMKAAGSPSAKLAADYKKAQTAASKASAEFQKQRDIFRTSRAAVEGFGASINKMAQAERAMKANVDAATAALRRQEVALARRDFVAKRHDDVMRARAARASERRAIVGGMAAGAGIYGAYKARSFAGGAISQYGEYDYAVRRQRAFAGMSEKEQRETLLPQARRIATDTKFSNQDVIESQTEVARRLPSHLQRGSVIAPVVDQAKNYALATKDVDMNMSAQAVTGYLTSSGKDISSAEKAAQEARRATNRLIKMQKIGGLGHDDLMPFIQRGVSSGRIAGLSDETMGAFAVGLKRNNISGDQAGTALRTISAKLVAPTQKGLAALASTGIDYDKFTTMPGGLSVDNLEKKFKQDFGKGFTPAIREALSDILDDPEIIGNRGAFTTAVTEATSDLFEKTKKGTMKAADQAKLAKKVGEFHKFSVESVNSEGLLMAILQSDPSLGVLNAFATDKHGNKLGLLGASLPQFMADRQELASVPDNYGGKIADDITAGFGGALEKLKGSVENLAIQMTDANEKWLTPAITKLGNAIDSLADLPEPIRQAMTSIGGAGAIIGGTAGLAGLAKLTLAGPALTEAAAALNVAATRLGGAPGGGAVPGGAAPDKPSLWSPFIQYGLYELGRGAIDTALGGLPKPAARPGYDAEKEKNLGTIDRARRAWGDISGWFGKGASAAVPADRVSQAFDAATSKGEEAGRKLSFGIAGGIGEAIPQIESQALAAHARIQSVFARGIKIPAFVQMPGAGLASPDGTRALGGPVVAGNLYEVGERGPELFAPSVSGTIIPNGGGGGAARQAPQISFGDIIINAPNVSDPREVARIVMSELGRSSANALSGAFYDIG